MSKNILLKVPINRVEGDLRVRVKIEDDVVTDAWSSGIMYRGFENLLVGRGPLDGLVLTPRICGLCGTAHLTAAAQALEMIQGVTPPPAAVRLRNIAMAVEKIQSDMRHAFLMFAVDFTNNLYRQSPFFAEACARYEPLKGTTSVEAIRETRDLLQIIAIIGGQWPHSSYMIPGGITSIPTSGELLQCHYQLDHFRRWYENRVLGCSLEQWSQVNSAVELDRWIETNDRSEIGLLIRFCRHHGLDKIGRGYSNYISFGVPVAGGDDPELPQVSIAGFAQPAGVENIDHEQIREYVDHSWYMDTDGARHPFQGETQPSATDQESRKYSWAKAPRYKDLPTETGPLAEAVIRKDPLITDLIRQFGPSVMLRQLARMVRPIILLKSIEHNLSRISEGDTFYTNPGRIRNGQGFGMIEATRGGLGHWVTIRNGEISQYQVITPTTWNASPRDGNGLRGPWEEALVGTPIQTPNNPVELGHVIRSYDACLYCTVHMMEKV
jgi:hydrogenase large subunit